MHDRSLLVLLQDNYQVIVHAPSQGSWIPFIDLGDLLMEHHRKNSFKEDDGEVKRLRVVETSHVVVDDRLRRVREESRYHRDPVWVQSLKFLCRLNLLCRRNRLCPSHAIQVLLGHRWSRAQRVITLSLTLPSVVDQICPFGSSISPREKFPTFFQFVEEISEGNSSWFLVSKLTTVGRALWCGHVTKGILNYICIPAAWTAGEIDRLQRDNWRIKCEGMEFGIRWWRRRVLYGPDIDTVQAR